MGDEPEEQGMKTTNIIIIAVLVIVMIGLIYFVFFNSESEGDDDSEVKGDEACLKKFNILEVVKRINVKQAKNLGRIRSRV